MSIPACSHGGHAYFFSCPKCRENAGLPPLLMACLEDSEVSTRDMSDWLKIKEQEKLGDEKSRREKEE
jgi:hypothetical protein